jgi:serine/threonine-protein kinase
VTCSKCGAPDQGSGRFCGVCGAATSMTEPSNPALGEAPQMIGREIAGRYRMLAKLGEGGMGAVYRAEQISLKRTVAVKLLRPDVLGNQLLLRRFNAEAEAVAKLSHPNTVNIYDFGQDTDGTLFIAMEYIEGRSLRSVVHREAPLAPRRALLIAQQIAASLADAHAHAIVHRDLKPDNVMLQDRGREHDIARVLDFGIAKLRDDNRATQMQMTQQGDMLGTPQYMAPEQIRAETIDGRTDVYALGCLLYEMVTARLPHEAPTVLAMLSKHLLEQPPAPSQRRPELGLPPALDALIMAAMAKEPALRPQTMDAVSERIAEVLAIFPADGSGAMRAIGGMSRPPPERPERPERIETPAAHSVAASRGMAPVAASQGFAAYAQPRATPYSPMPPAAPQVAPPVPAPPSRLVPMLTIVGLLGVGIAAIVVFGRSPDPPPGPAVVVPTPPPAPPSTNDPWAGSAAPPRPPANDPWANHVDGTKLEVGQGVQLIAPPRFAVGKRGPMTTFTNRDVVIFAAPIDFPIDDPNALAADFAHRNGLELDRRDTLPVGGEDRPVFSFHGYDHTVPVRVAAMPVIGPGYRMAVAIRAPSYHFQADKALQQLFVELFTQRIVLP